MTNIWLNGEGPHTCCPPSNGSRLAVMPVILGGFSWEGEIPGNGPFSLIVQAEGAAPAASEWSVPKAKTSGPGEAPDPLVPRPNP